MKRMEGRGGIDAARPHSESVTNMKRVLSLLLAAAFAGASPALAQTEASPVAQIGDTTYTDALAAFTALKDGETLVLLDDCVCAKTPTVKAFGVTVDLNGHTLWGKYEASLKKNAGSGLKFEPTSSMSPSKPEYNYFRVIDSSEGKTGTIKGQLPVRASTSSSKNRAFLDIAETVTLTPTTDAFGSVCVELGTGTRVPAETRYIAWLGSEQPLFKATDGENASWIFPKFGNAAPYAADGVVTLCADYSGSEQLTLSGKTLTLDLDGHTYEFLAATGSKTEIVTCSSSDTHMTIRNGTLKGNCGGVTYAPPPEETIRDCSLTLENVTLASTFAAVGHGFGLSANGTMENIDFTLRDCKLLLGPFAAEADGTQTLAEPDANADIQAIYFPPRGDSTLTIEDTVIKSPYGVQVCAGNLVVSGNTQITVTADNLAATKEGDGSIPDGAAISIVSRAGYGDIGTVTISGTPTLIAKGANATAVAAYAWNGTDKTQADWPDAAEHVTISGGTFSTPVNDAYLAEGHTTIVIDGQTVVAAGTAENPAAAIEKDGAYTACATLAEAISRAPANTPTSIVLLENCENITPTITIPATGQQRKELTIDLNGHDIAFADGASFLLKDCALTLTGTGTVREQVPETAPVVIAGTGAASGYRASLFVDEGVTLQGFAGIIIQPVSASLEAAYNVDVTVAGTLKAVADAGGVAGYGITVNGNIKNTESAPVITLTETSKIDSAGSGIYAAGYAKWKLAGAVKARTALVVRSGDITITGGTYASVMEDTFETVTVDISGGAVGTGAAISVSTAEGYAGATAIDIRGGTFSSANGPAVYEYAAPATAGGAAPASQVALSVTDGTFVSSAGYQPLLLTAMTDRQVIMGGLFNTKPVETYFVSGYAAEAKAGADGLFGVTVGPDTTWYASGEATRVWAIADVADLLALARTVNTDADTFAGGTVTLTADLDLGGVAWTPIGASKAGGADKNNGYFAGIFEGGNHTIANVSASQSGLNAGAGLFGWVRGATIRNLQVSGSLTSKESPVGIVGTIDRGETVITNVRNVGGTVRGSCAGGIVGAILGGTVTLTDCTNAAAVTATMNHADKVDVLSAGGLVGEVSATGGQTIVNGVNTGIVTAYPDEEGVAKGTPAYAGGIVGRMCDGALAGCDGGTAEVSGTNGSGRLIGALASPYTALDLSVEPTAAEAEEGRIALFSGATGTPSALTVTVDVAEGAEAPDATALAIDGGTLYCNLLTFTGETENEELDANAVAKLTAAGGALYGAIAVSGATAGKALTTAQVNDALACFAGDGLVTAEAQTLTVAYDFGVASAQVGTDGSLTVVARVQGADNKPVTFAPGTTVQLIDAENAAAAPLAKIALEADADTDTVTFKGVALPEAGKDLRLAVRILPPARE